MLIEPGTIQTPIWDNALAAIDQLERSLPIDARRRYGTFLKAGRRFNAPGKAAWIPADRVAAAIESALTSARPRARCLVGRDAKMLGMLASPARMTSRCAR